MEDIAENKFAPVWSGERNSTDAEDFGVPVDPLDGVGTWQIG